MNVKSILYAENVRGRQKKATSRWCQRWCDRPQGSSPHTDLWFSCRGRCRIGRKSIDIALCLLNFGDAAEINDRVFFLFFSAVDDDNDTDDGLGERCA